MSRNYKFHNPEGIYFISFAVVSWLDVFTRNEYKDIIVDSLLNDNHPIELWTNKVIDEKIEYLPVRSGGRTQ